MRWYRTGPLLASLVVGATSPSLGQASGGAGAVPFERYKLDNGLEVILSEDHSVPVVAVDLWYHVGSYNERVGRTGFAHLFEHMMFQGSQNVAKGEHLQLVERAGGSMNGSTADDRTNYFESLPANRLNLGLWLEADRMKSLAITPENLKNQIEVVKEEKRLRVDNAPYQGALRSALAEIPYDSAGCFAYGHPGIGSMEDLDSAKVEDVRSFFGTYYAPNNATLTVVGDFEPQATRAMIQEYFGGIPSGGEIPAVSCENAFAKLPVTVTVPDRNATIPALFVTYGMPATGNADMYPLRLLASILAGGESSRMNQRMVRQEKIALEVFSFPDFRKGPGVLLIGAIANQGIEPDTLLGSIEDELAKVRAGGVTAAELEKAKNQYRAETIRGLQTALGKAEALQSANLYYGDPGAIQTDLERTLAVTAADVKRVANEYLVAKNRATVITQPAAGQTAAKE
jgi:predicted Zn-dependent peptidase